MDLLLPAAYVLHAGHFLVHLLGGTEVAELEDVVPLHVHQQVLGLDVPVHDVQAFQMQSKKPKNKAPLQLLVLQYSYFR